MGIDTWESRTRDLDEKKKGLLAKSRNKELLEGGVFKLKSFGTGKFGRVLGEIFVDPAVVGEHIQECISSPDSDIDLSADGWVSVNDILIEEGHAYDYHGGKKKDFKKEIKEEKQAAKASIKDV
jgi:endonuclease YncB( thermonuclease family)